VYFYEVKKKFEKFLHRPDLEQELVETFQNEYNVIEEDFRADADVKAELHLRVEEMKERLWEIADRRRDEADVERIAIIDDRWPEEQSYNLVNTMITIIQAEVDRFMACRQFILDYYRDANTVLYTDIPKNQLKIPFLEPASPPAIEVASALISLSEQIASSRKDQKEAVNKDSAKPEKSKEATSKDNKKAAEKDKKPPVAKNAEQNKQSNAQAAPQPEKEVLPSLDPENMNFPEIQNTVDFVLNALQNELSIELILAQDIKDMKKAVPDKSTIGEDHDVPESHKIIETEEKLLKLRIEKIKQVAMEGLKELRNRALDVYVTLDDWIGQRYRAEIDVARDLANLIKEAIENEQLLPNYLLLQGEQLKIDYSKLVYEPKEEPLPPTPSEKVNPDRFTVLQIRNIAQELRHLAPKGNISVKNMTDYLAKLAILKAAYDVLPDGYVNADYQLLQQTVEILDPYETGFINWRKFLMLHTRLMSIDESIIIETKQSIQSLPNFSTGVTKDAYDSLKLWFEPENEVGPHVFDRAGKLKEALFSNQSLIQLLFPPTNNHVSILTKLHLQLATLKLSKVKYPPSLYPLFRSILTGENSCFAAVWMKSLNNHFEKPLWCYKMKIQLVM
jgi:hypothetical protein